MPGFKTLPIKFKLMLIMMATSCTAITLMAFSVLVYQTIDSQRAIRQQLNTLADVLGSRSTGALTFDDPTTGTEILSALAVKSNVIYAVIKRVSGDTFAVYGNVSESNLAPELSILTPTVQVAPFWSVVLSNEIQVSRDIRLENERIGRIWIIANLSELHNDLLNYLLLVTSISVICFAIAFLICARLQKIVSDPIRNLQTAMDSVSKSKDYSLRVEDVEDNELGAFVSGFNHMLEQIQIRDSKLARYSTHLEKIVATRTLQLTDANKKRILWLESMARFLRHELKNSSVGIKTSLDLIERRTPENQNVDIYLARARKSMANMNALLQSAGDASNLEASLYKEEHKHLNWGAIVIVHLETYAEIYPNISMNVNCQPEVFVSGSEARLNQLLDKLISNAVEHSDRQMPIGISVKQLNGKAQLLVRNKGDALPKDRKTMFDLFVSLRSPERKTDENFGLGLYIVKLIAESHGGRVDAYDIDGEKGAAFEVTLPIVYPE